VIEIPARSDDARTVTVPGTDHLAPLTHPDLLAGAIAQQVTSYPD
jgi:pimeloyl-ACP methyl ester carboxylesterase